MPLRHSVHRLRTACLRLVRPLSIFKAPDGDAVCKLSVLLIGRLLRNGKYLISRLIPDRSENLLKAFEDGVHRSGHRLLSGLSPAWRQAKQEWALFKLSVGRWVCLVVVNVGAAFVFSPLHCLCRLLQLIDVECHRVFTAVARSRHIVRIRGTCHGAIQVACATLSGRRRLRWLFGAPLASEAALKLAWNGVFNGCEEVLSLLPLALATLWSIWRDPRTHHDLAIWAILRNLLVFIAFTIWRVEVHFLILARWEGKFWF